VTRALAAEAVGTALLVATVVGSGIMASQLAAGNDAVALLGNTAATAAVLYVLISLLGPISGAQFNPVVTLLFGPRRSLTIAVQIAAALAGTLLAHAMFGETLLQLSSKTRATPGEWLGEIVATFGLVMTIRLGVRYRPEAVPALVAAWITAGYWFTSSTSFANPAVTIARMLSDSFAGIRPADVPAFVMAQFTGGVLGYWLSGWLMEAGNASSDLSQSGVRNVAQDAGNP
jgi:glycerol uptake facilitator-like aquaporin